MPELKMKTLTVWYAVRVFFSSIVNTYQRYIVSMKNQNIFEAGER